MAKLTPASTSPADLPAEAALRSRIAELEALLDARTQAIVGMGARLAELNGNAPPALTERLAEAEQRLQQLQATKVIRYTAVPRRIYAKLRSR
jgi:hypothetical protein